MHLPPDGNPLPGYQLALADHERGQRTAPTPQKRSLLASLFNRDKDAEEADDTSSSEETGTSARVSNTLCQLEACQLELLTDESRALLAEL